MTAGRSVVYTLHLWPPIAHARHYTGSAFERQLARRLTDHALGRGARLTQVQVERGGSWVLGNLQPGGFDRERELKAMHQGSRHCDVCKAIESYRAGELSPEQALSRARWDHASQHERGLLLDMFGIDHVPVSQAAPDRLPEVRAARELPAPWPAPDVQYQITPEIEALVGQLERSWSRQAEAGTQAQGGIDAEPELEAQA